MLHCDKSSGHKMGDLAHPVVIVPTPSTQTPLLIYKLNQCKLYVSLTSICCETSSTLTRESSISEASIDTSTTIHTRSTITWEQSYTTVSTSVVWGTITSVGSMQ